ncbi:MAG: hypothetical protein WCX82_00725 [archaeon]|jgi:preprotein translocase subunit SecF
MKIITEKNYKKLMFIPLIVGIICLFLIFIYPQVHKGIDLKGGNQLILRYEGEKIDHATLESQIRQNYSLQEVTISETTGPTSTGLIIEYSGAPEIDDAKLAKNKMDFVNSNLGDLKVKAKDVLTPLLAKNYVSSKDISDIETITSKDDLKVYLNETIILANNNFNNSLINLVKSELGLGDDAKIQTREVSATLGKDFIRSSITVGIIAFALLILVIFLFFREAVPSGLIVFAAMFDILAGLAGMAIMGLPLSLATIPTLLMLVGYSVDTDILLSTKLLKQRTTSLCDAANGSMKTGLTMTITTIVAVTVMLIISYFTQMLVILEIAAILLFGLVGDLISTWFFNAPALIMYIKNRDKQKN